MPLRLRRFEIPFPVKWTPRNVVRELRPVLALVCALLLLANGCNGGDETAEPTPAEGDVAAVEAATATPGRSQIPTRTLTRVPTSTPGTSSADLTATAAQAAEDNATAPTNTPEPTPDTRTVTCVVGNTDGEGVFIRAAPQTGEKIEAWWDGSKLVQVGPDEVVGGRSWKNVRDPDGNVGFVAADYVECGIEEDEFEGSSPEPFEPPTPNPDPNVPVCVVANTGGQGVYIRRNPTSEEAIKLWDEGTEMAVVGTNVLSNGLRWKHVRDPDGNVGYVAAKYLECPEPVETVEPSES